MFVFTMYVVFGVFYVGHELYSWSMMSTDEVTNDNTGSTSPLPDVTDDSCRLQVTDIVPLTTHAARECDSGNLCFEVKPELLPVVKQEPDDLFGLQFAETVPLTTDDVCSSTAECDSSILCFQVKPETLEAVKQERDDLQVWCTWIFYRP